MKSSHSSLADITIQVSSELTYNITPLLHQIRHALANLLENGISDIIDLRSIPLAPGEEQTLLETLGQGEVNASLSALGQSEIIETRFAGVWLVSHFNEEGELTSRHIEVTHMPAILHSQTEDMHQSLHSLNQLLEDEANQAAETEKQS